MSRKMRLRPRQEVSYSLIEASDTEWSKDGTGAPSVIAHVMEVDFQRRTVTLPEGKFDLGNFLRVVEDMQLRLRSP
jgi:hypothetical protein